MIAPAGPRRVETATGTILIVDDDPSVAETFARMLTLEGFDVTTALSADAGLRIAGSLRPDAIILDMRMPITNGLEFLRRLRGLTPSQNIPVAIVTGDYFISDPVQQDLLDLGAAIRFKPLWHDELIALARTLVNASVA